MSKRRDRPAAVPPMGRKAYATRLIAASIILTCLGCGETKSPVQSTPVLAALPGPVQFSLWGVIQDTANRPVADVRVEVVDGPQPGSFAMSDTPGRYYPPGVVSDAVTVEATKSGYVATTKHVPKAAGQQYVPFTLDL